MHTLPFPARWSLANVAPLVALGLVIVAMGPLVRHPAMAVVGHVAVVAAIAAAQGAVMAGRGYSRRRWALATVAGVVGGGLLGVATLATLDTMGYELLGVCLGMMVLGAVLGAAHARAMRRGTPADSGDGGRASRARWWVPASAAAWLVAGALWALGWRLGRGVIHGGGLLTPFARLYESGFAELVLLAMGFAIYGLLTMGLLPGRRATARPVPATGEV